MITFGLVSSVFDYMTFGLLLLVLRVNEGQFRTGWFVESVISASIIVLVIRSRSLSQEQTGKYLLITTLSIALLTLILPFHPLGKVFGFTPLSLSTYLFLLLIVVVYIFAAEITKNIFYKKVKF